MFLFSRDCGVKDEVEAVTVITFSSYAELIFPSDGPRYETFSALHSAKTVFSGERAGALTVSHAYSTKLPGQTKRRS